MQFNEHEPAHVPSDFRTTCVVADWHKLHVGAVEPIVHDPGAQNWLQAIFQPTFINQHLMSR
jgi:hypothetical protein